MSRITSALAVQRAFHGVLTRALVLDALEGTDPSDPVYQTLMQQQEFRDMCDHWQRDKQARGRMLPVTMLIDADISSISTLHHFACNADTCQNMICV
jgi:hypothetical protein